MRLYDETCLERWERRKREGMVRGIDRSPQAWWVNRSSRSDEEKAKWLARSCRITGQDQNLLRTERQVAEDILAAFATIRAEAKRDGAAEEREACAKVLDDLAAALETIARLQRALQGIFPLAKATADRVAFYEDIDTNAALSGKGAGE